jgi:K+-sensing histidine kinase KdpD
MITALLQVIPTRLIQAVRNKLLRAFSHDLLEHLVASMLASSTLLQDDNNLFQTCQRGEPVVNLQSSE